MFTDHVFKKDLFSSLPILTYLFRREAFSFFSIGRNDYGQRAPFWVFTCQSGNGAKVHLLLAPFYSLIQNVQAHSSSVLMNLSCNAIRKSLLAALNKLPIILWRRPQKGLVILVVLNRVTVHSFTNAKILKFSSYLISLHFELLF